MLNVCSTLLWWVALRLPTLRLANRDWVRATGAGRMTPYMGKADAEVPMLLDLTDQDGLPTPAARPLWIVEAVRRIELDFHPTPEQRAILDRLLFDTRMNSVWRELKRRPAQARAAWSASPALPDVLTDAMAETLQFAFRTAQDQRTATKLDEAEALRFSLLQEAKTLSRVADDVTASVRAAPRYIADTTDLSQFLADADALRRIAAWREALAATIRGADDPITIANSRGDPIERGVQITIAAFLKDRFGDYLHGTAATLTAVALGLSQTPSPRVSRSAFPAPRAARRSRARSGKK